MGWMEEFVYILVCLFRNYILINEIQQLGYMNMLRTESSYYIRHIYTDMLIL